MNSEVINKSETKHSVSLDILKIIFCIMVVWLHASSYGDAWGDVIKYSVTSMCVAGFMAVSGYLLFFRKEYTYKEILKGPILRYSVCFIFWSFFNILRSYEKGYGSFINFWIVNSEGWHLWYLKVYIQILVAYPIIRTITRDRKAIKIFSILWIIFFSFKYTLSIHAGWETYLRLINFPFSEFIINRIGGGTTSAYYPTECLGCFLTGGYIIDIFENNVSKNKYKMGIFCGVIGYIVTFTIVSYSIKNKLDIGNGRSQFDINVQMYLWGVIALIYFLVNVNKYKINQKIKGILSFIADKTLGVYILHAFMMTIYLKIPIKLGGGVLL